MLLDGNSFNPQPPARLMKASKARPTGQLWAAGLCCAVVLAPFPPALANHFTELVRGRGRGEGQRGAFGIASSNVAHDLRPLTLSLSPDMPCAQGQTNAGGEETVGDRVLVLSEWHSRNKY